LPDLASLPGLLPAHDALLLLLGAALVGGLVRGFAGFGFAMVFMPLATLAVPPVSAMVIIWFVDLPFALLLGRRAAAEADKRQVLALLAAATLTFPLGLWIVLTIDVLAARWAIAIMILLAVALLAGGYRYRGRAGLPLTLGAGAASGFCSGISGLGGMPLALFWMSSADKAMASVRADMQLYFALASFSSGAILWWSGQLTLSAFVAALLVAPVYGLALLAGSHAYKLAPAEVYRRVAYTIITLAAVMALPLLDGVLR
jgi:uncharacterized membrane protein YfcA